ncbi:MAG: hypothetical protein KDB14_03050, partial [Planctomycetales bacterium]|nr:hypothetical protein [Planctomycetales bacterium]
DNPPADNTPADNTPADNTPADNTPADNTPADNKPADSKPADSKPADSKPLPPLEDPDNASILDAGLQFVSTQADTDPPTGPALGAPAEDATEAGGETPKDSPFKEEKDEFKPLDEVREQILLELARGRAQEKLDEALNSAQRDVEAFYRRRIQWESMNAQKGGEDAGEEPKLELAELAEKHGLVHGETDWVDYNTVGATELGKCKRETASMLGTQEITFADEAFGQPGELFDPARATQGADVTYLYWRTAIQDGQMPKFEDVREQVKEAWVFGKAREQAAAAAEKVVAAITPEKTLADVAGDRAGEVKATGDFTWLTYNLPPQFMSQIPPRVSKVPHVDEPGDEFMQKVFELKKGKATVAFNQSKRIAYVIRMSEESSTKDLRDDFIADVPEVEMQLAYSSANQFYPELMRELEKEMDFVYLLAE